MLFALLSAAHAEESFTIKSAEGLTVRYFISGAFGGVGGAVEADNGVASIPLQFEGKSAAAVKVILFKPGCEITVLSVDVNASAARSADFSCRPLPLIHLRGRMGSPERDRAVDAIIRYDAHWSHNFFGIRDGMIQTFELGRARVDANGRFEVTVPDFSKDVTSKNASLSVLVIEHDTGNLVARLVPPPVFQYEGLALKILPSYDYEIAFSPHR
jgi:hypothetical protein